MIKKIMVAVDLSEHSAYCRQYAAELLEALKAELVIINVVNRIEVRGVQKIAKGFDSFSVDKYMEEQKKERIEKIEELIKDMGYNPEDVKIIIKTGVPFQEILNAMEEECVDLLMMGTKGRSNLADVLLGSTAEKMFRHSKIPVLGVPLRSEGLKCAATQ